MDAIEELRQAIEAGDLGRCRTLIGPAWNEREGLRDYEDNRQTWAHNLATTIDHAAVEEGADPWDVIEGAVEVRVVEQQPPTEERAARFPDDDLTVDFGAPAPGSSQPMPAEVREAYEDRIRRSSERPGILHPPPPEPTQGDEWDPATVDAVVEALRGIYRAFVAMPDAGLTTDDPRWQWWHDTYPARQRALEALRSAERFKGAARDTGGRSG